MAHSELQLYGADSIRLLKHGTSEGVPWISEYAISVLIDVHDRLPDGSVPPMLSTSAVRQVVAFLVDSDEFPTAEHLAVKIAQTLLERYEFLGQATVDIRAKPLHRINGCAFTPAGEVEYLSTVEMTRETYILESGIDNLVVNRVGEMHPDGVYRDLFARTELGAPNIWKAKLQLKWQHGELPEQFETIRQRVLEIIFASLETKPLPAPQHWANQAAAAVLKEIGSIQRVTLAAEVRDLIPVDVERFGKENRRNLYWSAEETLGIFTVRLGCELEQPAPE